MSFAQYLRFISNHHKELLDCPPKAWINRELTAEYVSLLRKTNQETSVASTLHHLRLALRLIYPDIDWSWLLTITKRIAATAPRKTRKHGSMTSERLYLLGSELMDRAVADVVAVQNLESNCDGVSRRFADRASSALYPPTAYGDCDMDWQTADQSGRAVGAGYPPEDTKNDQALDFPISADLSRRIDTYLQEFRIRLPGADSHNGLWPSNKRRPMSDSAIYDAVRRRTKKAFGFGVICIGSGTPRDASGQYRIRSM